MAEWGWSSLPLIWGGPLPQPTLSTAFETRCPNGKKVIQYKRAKLEKWAPYLNNNGLMCRLSTYEDLECKGGSLGTGNRSPDMLCDIRQVTDTLLV